MGRGKLSFKDVLIDTLIIILIILNIYTWGLNIYSWCSNNLEYKETTLEYKILDVVDCYTNDILVLKKDIDKLFNNPKYFFNFKKLPENKNGRTSLILRFIDMDSELNCEDFVFSFTHELVHLTKVVKNERYCNLEAFRILFESNNEYFRYVALKWLNYDIIKKVPEKYSFAGHIEIYFDKKGIDFNTL